LYIDTPCSISLFLFFTCVCVCVCVCSGQPSARSEEEMEEVRQLEHNRRFQAAVLATMDKQLADMETGVCVCVCVCVCVKWAFVFIVADKESSQCIMQ
jgi:hypothetical protein